jgi:uracil-DNA glycosylase
MIKIHETVSRCRRCAGILDESRIIPRSGFPPDGTYTVMVIGGEPGQSAEGHLTPEQYKVRFDWRTPKNRNTVRLLFKAIHKAGIDWNTLFYTNAVKCPATPGEAPCCYSNCQPFLQEQIQTLNLRIIVVFGRAADRIGVPRAGRGQIVDSTFEGHPCVVVTHPQGATCAYLAEVGQHVRNKMSLNAGGRRVQRIRPN